MSTTAHPATGPAHQQRRNPLLLDLGWSAAVLLTALSGFAWAWFAVSFQLFGDTSDREDYLVAAGSHAATAGVLLLGAVALVAYHGPRWLVAAASTVGALDVMLALGARADAAAAGDPGPGLNTAWDGVGGILAAPWTWPLVVLGLTGAVRLARDAGRRRRRGSVAVRGRGAPTGR